MCLKFQSSKSSGPLKLKRKVYRHPNPPEARRAFEIEIGYFSEYSVIMGEYAHKQITTRNCPYQMASNHQTRAIFYVVWGVGNFNVICHINTIHDHKSAPVPLFFI